MDFKSFVQEGSKIYIMANDKKNNNSTDKNLPHDALFKRIMENDIAAREFLSEYLPQEVKDIIDLNTIKVQKESYIEPNLTKRLSDIVYKVDAKNNQEAFGQCFVDLIRVSNILGIETYEFDKMLWLIGSGGKDVLVNRLPSKKGKNNKTTYTIIGHNKV